MRLIQHYIESRQWAILEEYLDLIGAISERDAETTEGIVEAIQRRFGAPVPGTRDVNLRDGIAVVSISGPMFRYANLLTEISGATSYERVATDLGRLMADPNVERVILDINSPGGEVDGAGELADLIYSFRGEKPVTAYVSHLGTSAAYWVASAADEIVVAKTAMLGSIGAVLGVIDRSEADAKRGIKRMEFVSSFSPDKRLDPFSNDTDEAARAKMKLQGLVDRVGQVFVEMVAAYRGMDEAAIKATKGGLLVGADAVEAGLAERVGTLEGLIGQFTVAGQSASTSRSLAADGGLDISMEGPMDITLDILRSEHPDLVEALKAEGATAERSRILAIHDLDAPGHEAIKREAMADPKGTAGSAAASILSAKGEQEKRRAQAVQDGLDADEEDLEKVSAATLPAGEGDEEAALAASVLRFIPGAMKVAAAGGE